MSKAKPAARAAGDKVFVGGSAQDKAVLIGDIIECIATKGSKTLLITLSDLSEWLKQQPALSPSNLFRKQYGNLEHVFAHEDFSKIFRVENSVIRLESLDVLRGARDDGQLGPQLYERCVTMHTFKRRHDLNTLKTVGKNRCKNCGENYAELVNASQKMCNGTAHAPAFDWTRDDDVLQCEL